MQTIILTYGKQGSGKTTFVNSLSKAKEVIYEEIEYYPIEIITEQLEDFNFLAISVQDKNSLNPNFGYELNKLCKARGYKFIDMKFV